ncbi:peptidoglycan D,D-transpeptidase FtsI family protein [Cellvibrio sp. OA-2007]|uniref:peptidoglycan D,D-transpeptidase FtsI family protein n=1 Tax=Cellvibrio sp. OA-2007 TaxID=529823 RepID=UPI000A07A6ED|nr:penicillin-binding protein 2 [Cellvibrio sp. OA-2007]
MSRRSAFEPRTARPAAQPAGKPLKVARWRFYGVGVLLAALVMVLIAHVASLQVLPNADKGYEFLQDQGESRTLRTEIIPAYRGVITDRNGDPLAVSTPVSTLWANPKVLLQAPHRWGELAQALKFNKAELEARLARYGTKEFMYLQRQMSPEAAQAVLSLDIPGVYEQVEYHRYYPAADVAAHLVGMTDVDDRGQEGMELAYDAWLTGENGAKEVVKDLRGRTVKELRLVKAARPGQNLTLSIDLRLQYLAHRELKKAVEDAGAVAGSIVILDVLTGEVLAISNLPSYNPNDRGRARGAGLRNRAITDLYEPGSTVKPWVVLAALESGKFKPEDIIDTNPGYIMVGSKRIPDHRNYGAMDLAMAIAKSSNVAMTKISFALDTNTVRDMFARLGIGQPIGTGFPGESAGRLPVFKPAQKIERANVSYGYALNSTVLQTVQAYGVIATGGIKRPISLLRVDASPNGERVVEKKYADQVKEMLKRVVSAEGTGSKAQAISYSVAGKTGTAFKAVNGKYSSLQISSFIGMAPVDNPRIVAMVVIDEPKGGGIMGNGGIVAAPAFSKVAEDALRMLQVPPDNIRKDDDKALIAEPALPATPKNTLRAERSET